VKLVNLIDMREICKRGREISRWLTENYVLLPLDKRTTCLLFRHFLPISSASLNFQQKGERQVDQLWTAYIDDGDVDAKWMPGGTATFCKYRSADLRLKKDAFSKQIGAHVTR
jgi:hypothetical protein